MTRYAYDCEFLEDGATIALISIGIVADDGREYYAVVADAPWHRIVEHDWLMANVVPSLPIELSQRGGLMAADPDVVRSRAEIAREVRAFLLAGETASELWAYYSAYDHVALCQLWGRMIDLPDGVPMWTNDLQQEIIRCGVEPPEQTAGLHNALDDARWVRDSLRWLERPVPAAPDGEETPDA